MTNTRVSDRADGRPPAPGAVLAILLALLVLAACAGDTRVGGRALDVERVERGDTTILRVRGGSVWGESARLVEELRIGRLEGRDEEMFGRIDEIAPDGHGGAWVFDAQAPALRHYDAEGRYTRTFGGPGRGPGEYGDDALGLWALPDGRILMHDPRNRRVNIYGSDGAPVDHWPIASGLFTSDATVVDTAGHVYLKILLSHPEANKPWPIGLLHLSPAGEVVDTIPPPVVAGDPQIADGFFAIQKHWAFSPLGYMIAGLNDPYFFEIRRPDGIIRVEMPHTPIPLESEEKAELEAINDYVRRTQGQFMTSDLPPVPDTKPAYRSLRVGLDGRIWVLLYQPAEKREPPPARPRPPNAPPPPPERTWFEPTIYDVFEPDGTYLGRLHLPPRTALMTMNGTEIWATQRGDLDEPYLVRFRLVTGDDAGQ